jgi:ectoine hydroxylase-related dioxygenase (phytanoyl-CoA dioxygenase family)
MITSALPALTDAQRFAFETDGFLVVENFLSPDHVARLTDATHRAIARRRELVRTNQEQTGFTHAKSEKSTRLFYILDDDPAFLELLDWPAIMPYVHGLLNKMPHHCASDVIVEHGADFMDRKGEWHIDGHDDGFRNLGVPIPLLQLKVGYYLSDMTAPWQGNLAVLPGSHKSRLAPTEADRQRRDFFPGVHQVCAPPARSAAARCSTTATSTRGWSRRRSTGATPRNSTTSASPPRARNFSTVSSSTRPKPAGVDNPPKPFRGCRG